jgi:hypothetical protein
MRYLPIFAAATIGVFAVTAANAQMGDRTGRQTMAPSTTGQGMSNDSMSGQMTTKKMSKKQMMQMKRTNMRAHM